MTTMPPVPPTPPTPPFAPHAPGQNTAAVKAALPDLIGSVAMIVSAAGVPESQRNATVKSVLDHTLTVLGGIGELAQPTFAPIIDIGIKTAIAFIDNAGGAPTSAADVAAAVAEMQSGFDATQIDSVDPLGKL